MGELRLALPFRAPLTSGFRLLSKKNECVDRKCCIPARTRRHGAN